MILDNEMEPIKRPQIEGNTLMYEVDLNTGDVRYAGEKPEDFGEDGVLTKARAPKIIELILLALMLPLFILVVIFMKLFRKI